MSRRDLTGNPTGAKNPFDNPSSDSTTQLLRLLQPDDDYDGQTDNLHHSNNPHTQSYQPISPPWRRDDSLSLGDSVDNSLLRHGGMGIDGKQGPRRGGKRISLHPSLLFAENDRYALVARALSQTLLLAQDTGSDQLSDDYYNSNNQSPNLSGDPVSAQPEFSPFGGYPALSFPLHINEKEDDDYLHNPDPLVDAEYEKNRFIHDLRNIDKRSFGGIVGIFIFFLICAVVFVILPILTYSGITNHGKPDVFVILLDYQYPILSAVRSVLVDPDTPQSAMLITARDGSTWPLVFSDEFNAEGRTFYEGDDQFWTAPDLHYDATKDLEWYDPDAATTANGTLQLRMDAFKNHDLFYRLGMLQLWNKVCFTEGHLDISAQLPNYGNVSGLWPGLWTLGNLARPGHLASTDGTWPYSYDSCDAGITANQSSPDGISYLPGQRLNSCTCKGEAHPNPGRGRGAPEIDAIEAEVDTKIGNGVASQSLQLAPMDIWYYPDYNFMEVYNNSVTTMNTYTGGPFQQALSATTVLNTTWYAMGNGLHNFQLYGFEYLSDQDTGYLQWHVGPDPTLTVHSKALHPNGNIGWRPISREPMLMILNLGISNNWAYIDWPSIHFPATFRIDYVRIYQPLGAVLGCDPPGYPTQNYINQFPDIYHNVNLTQFSQKYTWPKNSLTGCK